MKKTRLSNPGVAPFLSKWSGRFAFGAVLIFLLLRLSDLPHVIRGDLLRLALVKVGVASDVPEATRDAWFRAIERDALALASRCERRGCQAWYHLGVAALALGKEEVALGYMERAAAGAASQSHDLHLVCARLRYAELLAKEGRTDKAIRQLESAAGLLPADTDSVLAGEVYVLLANLLARSGRDDEAAVNYQRAARADRHKNEAYHRLMEYYTERNDTERVVYWHDRLAAVSPSDAWGPFLLAQMYLRSGEPASAIPHFQESIRLSPSTDASHFWLAVCYQNTGDFLAAIEEFSTASTLNPGSKHFRNRLQQACGKLRNSQDDNHALPLPCKSTQGD